MSSTTIGMILKGKCVPLALSLGLEPGTYGLTDRRYQPTELREHITAADPRKSALTEDVAPIQFLVLDITLTPHSQLASMRYFKAYRRLWCDWRDSNSQGFPDGF